MHFVYSPKYHADIGEHVFPIVKYRKVYERLVHEAGVPPEQFLTPEPATREELLLVHTPAYLDDLAYERWTHRTNASELPLTREIVQMSILACGGTILATRQAVKTGWAVHLSGGFHHAFADRAEGFCYINDLAVATRVVQKQGLVQRVAIIDCDLHQGNGTAVIFQGDDSVFTFSIHQRDLYPVKEKSDLDIHLPVGVQDEEYLNHLKYALPRIFREFAPELVLYQAGADPFKDDQLGNLALTIDGLRRRDEFVFQQCRKNDVPVAVTLGGGYAYRTEDTVQIHYNTCLAARAVLTQPS